MTVAIVDYGSGNLRSAAKAFERAAREAGVDDRVLVTSSPRDVAAADRIVLPGVGAFADCRRRARRRARHGRCAAARRCIERGQPFLGICVGMQLMADARRRVRADHAGLDWIAGEVVRIEPRHARPSRSRTWAGTRSTSASRIRCSPASRSAREGSMPISCTASTLRSPIAPISSPIADYGGPVTAFVARENYAGTQFHPEKSQKLGLALIANFLDWKP